MKKLVVLVSLVVLAFALPVFADVKVVPSPEKLKAIRDAEESALDKVFEPWLKVAGGKIKEIKPVYDRMIAEWEKLVQSGNYVALVKYADYRSRYAKTESDHLAAVRHWDAARKAAETSKEAEEAKTGWYVSVLHLFVYYNDTGKLSKEKYEPAKPAKK